MAHDNLWYLYRVLSSAHFELREPFDSRKNSLIRESGVVREFRPDLAMKRKQSTMRLALFIEFLFFISHLHDIELPVQILPRSKINSDICEELGTSPGPRNRLIALVKRANAHTKHKERVHGKIEV